MAFFEFWDLNRFMFDSKFLYLLNILIDQLLWLEILFIQFINIQISFKILIILCINLQLYLNGLTSKKMKSTYLIKREKTNSINIIWLSNTLE